MSDSLNLNPIFRDENGDWYSMTTMSLLLKRTPERVRQLSSAPNPIIIKDKTRGVILFRVADGYEIAEEGGLKIKE